MHLNPGSAGPFQLEAVVAIDRELTAVPLGGLLAGGARLDFCGAPFAERRMVAGSAPHAPEAVEGGAPLCAERPGWSAGPDKLVLAVVALDERGVHRSGEGWVIELEREVFGARLAGRAGPACSKLDTPCGDAEVGGPVIVAVAGLDGRLDAEGEGLDGACVGAVFFAGEGADLSHCCIS